MLLACHYLDKMFTHGHLSTFLVTPGTDRAQPITQPVASCGAPRVSLDSGANVDATQVAVNNEVFAAMSNANYASPGGMLDTWMEGVQRAGVKNAIVIALDSVTRQNAESKGIPAHEIHVEVRLTLTCCLESVVVC